MSDTNETLDEGKQPLIQHLVELRSRLIKSLILITVMFVIAYIFADTIYNFLVQPYADAVQGESGRRLIFTALHETFFTYLKVALFASIFVSLPFILIQIWIFVALYSQLRLIFAFGISFQLPVLLTLLARVGFVSSEGLRKNRKYVIVGVFAVAAILTPPDPISQIGLGIPILLLYEISIFAVKFIEGKKAKSE